MHYNCTDTKKRIVIKFLFYLCLCIFIFSCNTDSKKIPRIPGNKSDEQAAFESNPANKQAKNIIFLIGDGMGLSQIYAGLTANRGSLNLERIKYIGLSKTNSANNYITDSGASATAFATGKKTNNLSIGVDINGKPLPTILEIAEAHGLATGLVATSSITHATPAAFIAHQPHREMYEAIAADFLKTDIDVFIGGGSKHFNQRSDGKNLIDSLKVKGYQVLFDIDAIAQIDSNKLAGFIAEDQPVKMSEGRGDYLSKAAMTAINILNNNEKGFFLMIEGSQIDWGGHANDVQYIIDEMLDFDKVIGLVLDFARQDGQTLVVITADHETGGLAINGGDFLSGTVNGTFTTTNHTGVMVPVFAYGPGAEKFTGIYHNNTIFDKFIKVFGFNDD
ncbi:MAG: alkaline phosphatase [Cytophagales bacterium]|nr:alkaline phosphatase [Cytophagales bacterium]